MPNATTTPTTPATSATSSTPTTTSSTSDARQQHPRQPKREARRAAASETAPPTEAEQLADELLELSESANDLASRAKPLGLRRTARDAEHLANTLRAARTRLTTRATIKPIHLAAAQAYVEVAVEQLSSSAARIGELARRPEVRA